MYLLKGPFCQIWHILEGPLTWLIYTKALLGLTCRWRSLDIFTIRKVTIGLMIQDALFVWHIEEVIFCLTYPQIKSFVMHYHKDWSSLTKVKYFQTLFCCIWSRNFHWTGPFSLHTWRSFQFSLHNKQLALIEGQTACPCWGTNHLPLLRDK